MPTSPGEAKFRPVLLGLMLFAHYDNEIDPHDLDADDGGVLVFGPRPSEVTVEDLETLCDLGWEWNIADEHWFIDVS